MKNNSYANTSLLGKKYSKVLKESGLVILTAAFIVSGFFSPNSALATAGVAPASDGINISIDTTSAIGGTSAFSDLSGPAITENVAGDIVAGTHTITLPSGWEFDTTSNITIFKFSGNIVLGPTSVTPGPTSFSFVVNSQSTSASVLGFSGLKVRPTGTEPSTANMTYSGAGILGVDGSTNFGTLSTVPGTVTKLAFTTQPGDAVYGSSLTSQPVVVTRDQFDNNSTNGLVATEMVSLSLTTGSGALVGTVSLNIGTGGGNGMVTFSGLKVDEVGLKGLTASATGPTSGVSGTFNITQKPLTATVTVNGKPYDGTNTAVITGVLLNGLEPGDTVTINNQGTATFNNINVIEGNNAVSATGVTITGGDALNYNFNGTATGEANITPLGITVTPTAGQTKVYGEVDPVSFAYTNTPLIGTDGFTGALSRVAGENMNTYAYTLGTLSAGSNYSLTLTSGTFEITKRTLNVTATGINKVYDGNTTAIVTLSDDRVGGDELTLGYMANFTDENVGVGKTIDISGVSITGGADTGNYVLGSVPTTATADIIAKPLTVSFTTDTNKTYNGSVTAAITGRSLDGVISPDVVGVTGGSATFADKHIGTNKTVTATGFTLTGADKDNYEIGTINTTTGNVNPRPITVTAVTDTRTYNGTDGSTAIPTITSPNSPPVALVDTANFIQKFDTKHFGDNKTLTPSGSVNDGNSGANYEVAFATVSTGEIIKKPINVTAQPDTKVYDGTTSSDVVPVVDPLETLDTVGTAPTQSYLTKDVATSKTLEASGLVITDGNSGLNYNVIYVNDTTGVIEVKELTVAGAISVEKIYNGEVNDAVVNFGGASLNGVVTGEEALVSLDSTGYSATYDNKNVATGKQVTVLGLTLDGLGASNYSLIQPVLNDGVITVKTLAVTANGTTKVYDSTLDATGIIALSDNRVPGDVLTLTHTAAFLTKDVANGKDVNVTGIAITGGMDAGNYTLNGVTTAPATANITPATLTATIAASDKVYDGNDTAIITGYTPAVIGTDVVVLSGGVATFNNANVGDNKPVTAVDITHSGLDAGNYSYNGTATGNADIDPLGITGSFTADNKVYDGTKSATILTQTLTGVLTQDIGDVVLTGGMAEFADLNVNDDIVVTEIVAMTLTGSAALNYNLTDVLPTAANITKAPLTITANDQEREYGDANLPLTAEYDEFVEGEDESVLDTPVILNTLADETSPVSDYPITASGAEDNNYEITHENGTLIVTPAPIEIMPDEDQGKIYGDSDEEITYEASEFKNGEDKSVFEGALSRVAGENADEYDITIGTLDVGGNYFIDSFFDITYTIEPRALTISAVTDTKEYDGTIDSIGTPTTTGDLQFGQSPAFTQLFNSPGVGNDKVLTATGIVNDGNGGLNYTYDFTATAVGEITKLEIVITPNAGQSKVYGATEPTFTYTNTPNLIDGNFTGALGRVAGENVGTYAYNLGTLSAGGNYNLTLALSAPEFAITQATPVITWENPADIVYGAALSGTQLNATANVAGAFVYTPVSGTVLNAGNGQTLSVAFTPTDILNYNNAEKNVLINVTKASLTVTAENKSKEYLATDPALTYTNSGLVNGDTNAVFTGALEREEGELVGTYSILQGTLLAGGNYVISYTPGTFTIVDTVMPSVLSHTPSLNALNISPTTAIVVTFSEAVVVENGDVSFNPVISGGFTISNSGTSVATITPNNPLADNTTYTITLDGVADLNGNLLPTYSNIKFTTATIYSINLNANGSGWNLISLPVVPSNTAIATVLGSASSVIDAVWTYDPTNPNAVDGWLVYTGNPSTSNLDKMTAGFGYWMSITDDANLSGSGTLLIAGPTPPPSRSLQSGWNLIGYYQLPNEDESTSEDAFVSLGGSYTGLWGFDNTTGFFKSVDTILPGDAFWISLPSAKTYTPSNL